MERKLPKEWALMLAELHNKVMEIQDTFDTIKSDLYCDEYNEDTDLTKGYDLDQLEEELEYICDQLDTIEAETSELDCEYNDYESGCGDPMPKPMTTKELFATAYNDWLCVCARVNGEDFEEGFEEISQDCQITYKDSKLYDVNFGVCCFTIDNHNGKGFVNDCSIEVWDSDCGLIGNFTISEIAEKGEIE